MSKWHYLHTMISNVAKLVDFLKLQVSVCIQRYNGRMAVGIINLKTRQHLKDSTSALCENAQDLSGTVV